MQSALAGRDELISRLQDELAELREQAEQRQDAQAYETEIASISDAAAAQIAAVEAKAQTAVADRNELISQLQHEVAELQKGSRGKTTSPPRSPRSKPKCSRRSPIATS